MPNVRWRLFTCGGREEGSRKQSVVEAGHLTPYPAPFSPSMAFLSARWRTKPTRIQAWHNANWRDAEVLVEMRENMDGLGAGRVVVFHLVVIDLMGSGGGVMCWGAGAVAGSFARWGRSGACLGQWVNAASCITQHESLFFLRASGVRAWPWPCTPATLSRCGGVWGEGGSHILRLWLPMYIWTKYDSFNCRLYFFPEDHKMIASINTFSATAAVPLLPVTTGPGSSPPLLLPWRVLCCIFLPAHTAYRVNLK